MPQQMSNQNRADQTQPVYTVTIYVAAPGTPMLDENGKVKPEPSLSGHMYYSINNGTAEKGYGFAPKESEMAGPGRIVTDEQNIYVNPLYSRTMQISREQYEALQKHGQDSKKGIGDFNMNYHFLSNSCVDFVWKGLAKANLYRTTVDKQGNRVIDTDYEGSLKPSENIDDIRSIKAPLKNSPHNEEKSNPLPKQDWRHRGLSENDLAPSAPEIETAQSDQSLRDDGIQGPFNDPVLDKAFAALMDGDSNALDRIAADFSRSPDGQQMRQLGDSLLAEQNRQQQLAQQDAFVR